MRLLAGFVTVAALTAAFAFPTAAQAPQLSVEKAKYQIPMPDQLIDVKFTIKPPLTQGRDHIVSCFNQRFERAKLATDGGCREENANGAAMEDGHGTLQLSEPGRYEAYAQRLAVEGDKLTRSVSNVVSFEIFDFCRFVYDVVPLPPTRTVLRGAPAPCSGDGRRHVTLRSDDGSTLRIKASGLVFWRYDTNAIRVPLFVVNGQGTQVTIDFRGGSRLGRIVSQVSVPAVVLFVTAPTDLSVVHREGTATVRVRRGAAVGYRLTWFAIRDLVKQHCPARPTLRCLSRIHYTVGGLRKREEYGKVIRAGQSARFVYRGRR